MPPIQILHRLLIEARKFRINVPPFPLPIIAHHPQEQQSTNHQREPTCRQIKPIPDMIIGGIPRQKAPRANQAADVAEHDVCADGSGTRGVGNHVGGDLGVAERAVTVCAGGDQEGGTIAHVWVGRGEEHYVAGHHERRGQDEEDVAAVEFPSEEGEENGEELNIKLIGV